MEGQQHPKLVDGIYRARRSQIIPAVAIAQTKTATFSAKRFFADSFLVVFLLALIISGFNFYFKTPKIKTQILGFSSEAANHFELAKQAIVQNDLALAQLELTQSETNFNQAQLLLAKSGQNSNYLTNFQNSENQIILADSALNNAIELCYWLKKDLAHLESLSNFNQNQNLLTLISQIEKDITQTQKVALAAEKNLQNLPIQNAKTIRLELAQASTVLAKLQSVITVMPSIVGQSGSKSYLILFQNPAEARPAGGFIGNYGEITLTGGKVSKMKVDDVYNLRKEHLNDKEPMLKPEIPLKYLSDRLYFYEGNWKADFPTTAKEMMRLYQLYGEPAPSGVIALDPKIFEDIMGIIGDIEMPDYNATLNKANFRDTLMYKVEVDNAFKRGEGIYDPKKILQDFTPLFLQKIENSSKDQKVKIIKSLLQNLDEKHFLLYAKDQKVEEVIGNFGWSGALKSSSPDYLMVTNANTCGTKSSYKMGQSLNLSVNINNSGQVKNTLTITHDATKLSGLLADKDCSFVEVFVPSGSELLSAKMGEIDVPASQIFTFSELDKTVFGIKDFIVFAVQSSQLTLSWELPFQINNLSDHYQIYVQKQAGRDADPLAIEINKPANLSVSNFSPDYITQNLNNFKYLDVLKVDRQVNLRIK